MPENDVKKAMQEFQQKNDTKKNSSIMYEIRDALIKLNKNQNTIANLLKKPKSIQDDTKKERRKKKEDVQDDTKKERIKKKKDVQDDIKNEKGKKKKDVIGLDRLRKSFDKSFSTIKDTLSPGGLVRSFGTFTGSPLFLTIGDKIESLVDEYKYSGKEEIKANKNIEKARKDDKKNSFLDEQRMDEQVEIQNKQTELLQDIADKLEVEPKKEKEESLLSGPLKMFSRFLPKSLGKGLGGMFKGLLGGAGGVGGAGLGKGLGGMLKGGKGLGGMLKGGGRLLGKAALPLTLAFGAFDFYKGFKNVEEITGGKKDLRAKIEAGVSNAISGFTFGLIDPKLIYKGVSMFTEKLQEIFMIPFNLIKDVIEGKPIMDSIFKALSKYTYGFVTPEQIKKGVSWVVEKVKGIFTAPFDYIQKIVSGDSPVMERVIQNLSDKTFGLLSPEQVKNGILYFTEKLKTMFIAPFNMISGLISGQNPLEAIKGYVSDISFGIVTEENIKNVIQLVKDKLKAIFVDPVIAFKNDIMEVGNYIKDVITSFDISDTLDNIIPTETIDNIKSRLESFKQKFTEKIESLIGFIKDPIDQIKGFFNKITGLFGKEEEFKVKTPERYTLPERPDFGRYFNNRFDIPIQPIHKPNPVLEKINDERIEEIRLQRIKEDEKDKQLRAQNEKISTMINSNVNNNIIVTEDMSVYSKDRTFLRAAY